MVCGTQPPSREAEDRGRHSFSTTSGRLLLGAAPLRVRCFLICRREKGLRSWAWTLLLGGPGL